MLDWIANGLMTVQEQKLLKPYPSPSMLQSNFLLCSTLLTISKATKHFTGQYQNSQKEPDVLVRVNSQYHPTAVFESGWTESWNRLTNDVRLWLVDGSPNVNVVFLLKWSKKARSNQVSGFVEVYVREITSNPLVRQRLVSHPFHHPL